MRQRKLQNFGSLDAGNFGKTDYLSQYSNAVIPSRTVENVENQNS